MIAPGANLDFHESVAFAARVLGLEEIREAIRLHLRNNLNVGNLVCGQLYTLELTVGNRGVAYIYGRIGQRINIAYAFDVPKEEKEFRSRLVGMKKLHCPEQGRSRP
jgi:hypothetical protein